MSDFTKGSICVMGAFVLTIVGVLLAVTALPLKACVAVGAFAAVILAGVGLLVYGVLAGIRKTMKGG